jgi:hypothetical protein
MKTDSAVHIRNKIMCVSPPYTPFIHRCADFEREILRENTTAASNAWRALNIFLTEHMPAYLWDRQQTLPRGCSVTYEQLWNIFEPNDDVVVTDSLGSKEIHVLVTTRKKSTETRRVHRKNAKIELVLWGLEWDPIKRQVERRAWTTDIAAYEGERDILSLPIYPLRFTLTSQEEDTLIAELESRGHRWRKLSMTEIGTHHYKGMAFLFGNERTFVPKSVRFIVFISQNSDYNSLSLL